MRTFTSGTGVYTFASNSQAIAGGTAFTIGSVTVTGVTLTNSNTASFTVSTALAGTGAFLQSASAVLNLGGTSAITTLVASSTGNTVNFNGAVAQTVPGISYYTLKSNNTNATGAQLAGAATLTNLIVGDVALGVFDDNSHAITLNSDSSVTVYGGATYKMETDLAHVQYGHAEHDFHGAVRLRLCAGGGLGTCLQQPPPSSVPAPKRPTAA